MSVRQEKVAELIHKLAAEYIGRESNASSLITVTRADISRDLKNSTVFFTVLPEDKEAEAVEFLERRGYDFREFVKKRAKLRALPRISFTLDLGEKNRQLIEDISRRDK